jgi:hypothetical protein
MRYLPERGPRELIVLQPGIPSIRILKGSYLVIFRSRLPAGTRWSSI